MGLRQNPAYRQTRTSLIPNRRRGRAVALRGAGQADQAPAVARLPAGNKAASLPRMRQYHSARRTAAPPAGVRGRAGGGVAGVNGRAAGQQWEGHDRPAVVIERPQQGVRVGYRTGSAEATGVTAFKIVATVDGRSGLICKTIPARDIVSDDGIRKYRQGPVAYAAICF